jgi:hypothetical protein
MINNLSPKLIQSKQQEIRTKFNRERLHMHSINKVLSNKSIELDELQNPTRNHFNKLLTNTLNIPIKEPVYLLDDDE